MDVIFLLGAFLLISARRGLTQLLSATDGFQESNLSVGLIGQTSDTTGTEQFAKLSDSSLNTGSDGFSLEKLNYGIENLNLKSQANENKPAAEKLMSPEIKTNSEKLQSKALDSAHKSAYIETADIINMKVSDIIGINPNETVLDLNMVTSAEQNTAEDKHTREKSDKKLFGQTNINGSTSADVNSNADNNSVTYQGKLNNNSERKHDLLEKIIKSKDGNAVDKHRQLMISTANKAAIPKDKKLSHLSNKGLLNSNKIKTVSGSVRTYGGSIFGSSGNRNDKTVDLNNNAVLESLKLSTNMYEVKDAGISIEKTNSKSPRFNLNNKVKDLNNRLDAPIISDIRQENDESKITQKNSGKFIDEATFSFYDKTDGFETIKIKQPDSSSVLYSNEINVDENKHGFTKKVQTELIGASTSENLSSVLKESKPKGAIWQKGDSTSTVGSSSKSLEGNVDERKSNTQLEISLLKDKQFVRQPQTISELIRLIGIDPKLVQNLFTKNVKNAKNVLDISSSANRDGLGITEYKHSPSESDGSVKSDYHTDKKQVSPGNEIHLLNNLNNEPLKKLHAETNNSPEGFSNVPAFIPYIAELNKGTIETVSTVHDKPGKQSAEDVNVVVKIRGLNALPNSARGVSDGFLLQGKPDIQTPKYAHVNERKTGHVPSKSSKQVYERTDGLINHDINRAVLSGQEGVDGFINGNLDSNTLNSELSQHFIDPRKQTFSKNRHYSTLRNENIVQRYASSDSNVPDRGQNDAVTFGRNRLPTIPGAELRAASSMERNFYSSGSLNGLGRYPLVDSHGRQGSKDVVLRRRGSDIDIRRENVLNPVSSRGEIRSGFRNSSLHRSFRGALPAQRDDTITRGGSSRPDVLYRSGVHMPFRRDFSGSGPTFRRDFSRVSGPRFRERTYPLRFRTPSLPSDRTRFTGTNSASPSTLYRTRPHRLPPGGFMGRRFPLPGVPPGVRPFTPAMTPMPFRFF